MSLAFFWRCEGETLDPTHDYSAGDTTATASASPSISATAVKIGTNGALYDAASEAYTFAAASIIFPSAGAAGFWAQFPSAFPASGGAYLFYAHGTNASNDFIRVETLSGGGPTARRARLRIRSGGGTIINQELTTASLAPGNWYWFGIGWDSAAPNMRIAVYDSTGTLLENSAAATAFTAPVDLVSVIYGDLTGSTGTLYRDNEFIGSAYSDVDTFLINRDITSYTAYSSGVIARAQRMALLGVN